MLLLATVMPPYQNPDEREHLIRADQVSNGGWLARSGPSAPSLIDTGVMTAAQPFRQVGADPQLHVNRAMYVPVGWGGRQVEGAQNTALYPPTFYLPAAAAIRIGKRAGLDVLPTLRLCRVLSGAVSVGVGVLAIALAGPAAVWLFAVLSLPTCLAQMSACGQDGPMIACVALAVACALRSQVADRRGWAWLALLCVCVTLVGMARPPLAAFGLLALLAGSVPLAVRIAAMMTVLSLTAGWSWLTVAVSGVDPAHFNGSDAYAQGVQLLRAPWKMVLVAYHTLRMSREEYAEEFVGKLGWLNLTLPASFRAAAAAVLGWAALLAWRSGRGARAPHAVAIIGVALVGGVAGMFAIQYLTWTKVGAVAVDGMQGRYFLQPALVLGLLFARPSSSGSRVAAFGAWPVALFPPVTIVVCVHQSLLRYYL